jgi:hypothetical protein
MSENALTSATAEQLRGDADVFRQRLCAHNCNACRECRRYNRAAAALDAEAARREAQHAELRGWGVMQPDGTLLNLWHFFPDAPREEAARLTLWTEKPHRAVPVRLTTEAPDAK